MEHLKTPTKKGSLECSPLKSPKFLKPKILKRSITRNDTTGSKKFSPSKASTAAIRRCKLPIEHVEKIYSPLKCLQPRNSEPKCHINNKSPKKLTFSPLLRKLRRSPKNNQISFPVVKRSLQNISQTNNKRNFNRILDFNEDTQLPDPISFQMKCLSKNITNNNTFNIDWSLKTRLRIFINHSIPFHGTFNALDETTGMNYFIRQPKEFSTDAHNSFNVDLQQHCLVWQWPVFPWMNLFPRYPELKPGSLLLSKKPSVFTISASGILADSLYSNFCNSFQSLFKMLKTKYCPFFYLCANNFVALFRASGVSNSLDPHVLISPTSLGFRKLLEDEGIDYLMPFHNNNSLKVNDELKSESKVDISDIDDDDDEAIETFDWTEDNDSTQWLESLGLSEQDFPSLETASFRRRRFIARESNGKNKTIDDQSSHGKVKSLIRINGINNLQLLVNLFVKYRKISTSTSGSFAGIPPTLLSPVAFFGATLQKIHINQKSTHYNKKPINNNDEEALTPTTLSTLDFTGPILPNTVYGLVNLLRKFLIDTCPPNTKIRSTMRIYEASASFPLEAAFSLEKKNAEPEDESMKSNTIFAVENLQYSGIDEKFLSAICTIDHHSTVPIIDFELLSNNIFYNRFALKTNRNS